MSTVIAAAFNYVQDLADSLLKQRETDATDENVQWIIEIPGTWSAQLIKHIREGRSHLRKKRVPSEDFESQIAELKAQNERYKEQLSNSRNQQQTMESELASLRVQNAEQKLQSDNKLVSLQSQIKQHLERISTVEDVNESLLEKNKSLMESISTLETENKTKEEAMETLRNDLNEANDTILGMTNVVSVNQLFPTVDETLDKFRFLYDQNYHGANKVLKKYLKSKQSDWQKYYIAQRVHRVMFNVLMKSYEEVGAFRKMMFRNVANSLNMREAFENSGASKEDDNEHSDDDDEKESGDAIEWEKKSMDIISKCFGSYLKSNYETILKREEVAAKVMQSVMEKEYADYLKDLAEDEAEMEAPREFAKKCCDICWILILHEPQLRLSPNEWEAADDVMFNDESFVRNMGSDRKADKVLYYVWPGVAKDDLVLGDQKWRVITRNEMYTPQK